MKRILGLIIEFSFIQELSDRLKTIYINRSHGVSFYRFFEIFITQIKKNNIGERANAMAFSFLLSMFPAIIFIFTIIPFIPIPHLEDMIMFSLKSLLPLSVYNGVAAAIYDILHIPHDGLISLGFAIAIFSATNGIMAMINAFNRCYRTIETRTYFRRLFIGISIVFLLLLIVILSLAVAILFRHYLTELRLNDHYLFYALVGMKYLFLFSVFFFTISIIYYLAPAVTVRWKLFSVGSMVASVLIVLFTVFFTYYLNSFDSYNKLYGSLGALIGMMLWIYGISLMLLIGFEINASIDMAKRELSKSNS